MLFRQVFHDGIRSGRIERTVRAWDKARVKPGGRYRLGPRGVVVVSTIERVRLDQISGDDARLSGFVDRDELVGELRRSASRRIGARTPVFRIRFGYQEEDDARVSLGRDSASAALDDVARRLERMDARSRRGPWTSAVLKLLAEHPRSAASKLAREVDRETRAFKADVRKLKALGLTVSHEVGYSLSPRGEALLLRLRRASRRRPS